MDLEAVVAPSVADEAKKRLPRNTVPEMQAKAATTNLAVQEL
jgi:hypothetical protein